MRSTRNSEIDAIWRRGNRPGRRDNRLAVTATFHGDEVSIEQSISGLTLDSDLSVTPMSAAFLWGLLSTSYLVAPFLVPYTSASRLMTVATVL
jgi:hypothetical protein